MITIQGRYLGGLRCEAVHGPSSNQLVTDAPVDNRGKGEAFSPTDLAATSLGTCMATIMGIKADDLGVNLEGLSFEVTKEMAAQPPRRISRLRVAFKMPPGLDEATRTKLQRAAETCPVHASLHPDIVVDTTYDWGDA